MADRSSSKAFKYPGGFLKSEPWYYSEDDADEHIYVVVWGEIIHDPRIYIYKNGNKKTEFAIRYRRGGHIVLTMWGDTPAADEAAMLKAKERVIAFGIITKHDYTNRHGDEKSVQFFTPMFVIPCDRLLEVFNFAIRMMNSPSINQMIDADEEDVFESAGDYVAEVPEEPKKDGEIEDLFV